MCLRPLYMIRKCEHCDYLEDTRVHKLVRVPCGKCIECLKKRQNDICVRVVTEAQKYGSMHFVTLTYDDEHLPLSAALWFRCRENDSIAAEYRLDVPQILSEKDCPMLPAWRKEFTYIKASNKPRYLYYPLPAFSGAYGDGTEFYLTISPSLNRRDVRLWLKSARVAYEREFGVKLPKFSFVQCGEYGSRSCRPHYHLLLLGLSDSQVAWLCSRWDYGYFLWKRCNTDSKDKFAVGRYISKYMSKGTFNCPSVIDGDVEKSRYSTSKYFGQADNLPIAYFLCYDIFGYYDPMSLKKKNGDVLTDFELSTLCEEIPKRMSIPLQGCPFLMPLPQAWKKKIYYLKFDNTNVYKDSTKVRYVPKRIFKIVQDYLLDINLQADKREFDEFASRFSDSTRLSEVCLRFKAYKESCALSAQKCGEDSLVKFYSSDAF